jgi:hypothetical protein
MRRVFVALSARNDENRPALLFQIIALSFSLVRTGLFVDG